MNTRLLMLGVFIMMLVATVFQQLTIRGLESTIATQKEVISIQDNTIKDAKRALEESTAAMKNANEAMEAQGRVIRKLIAIYE